MGARLNKRGGNRWEGRQVRKVASLLAQALSKESSPNIIKIVQIADALAFFVPLLLVQTLYGEHEWKGGSAYEAHSFGSFGSCSYDSDGGGFGLARYGGHLLRV